MEHKQYLIIYAEYAAIHTQAICHENAGKNLVCYTVAKSERIFMLMTSPPLF